MKTEASPETQPTTAPAGDRLRRALTHALLVFLGVRIGLAVVALLATALLPSGPNPPLSAVGWDTAPITPGWHNLVTAWERFDGLWLLGIAGEGYVPEVPDVTSGNAVFFPLYPMAIRGLSFLIGGHPLAAALLISNLAFLGTLVALYVLTDIEWGETVARRSTLYLALLPTAYFFLAPYTESLFLLLVLLAFLAARRHRWLLAGLAGSGAALTRNHGAVVGLALLFEGVHQAWERRMSGDATPPGLASRLGWWARGMWRPAGAALLTLAGTGAYLLFWWKLAREPLAPLTQQASWQRDFELPWVTLWLGTKEAFRWIGQYPGGYHLMDWLLVAPALVAALWVAVRTRLSYAVYTWVSLIVPLSFIFAPRPFMSLPRFLLPLFPLVWAPALWAERRPGVHTVMVAASAAGLGVMTVLFVTWYFVF